MDECKVIQVIFCSKKRNGTGKSELSPIRIVNEIFDFEGNLLMDNDPERIFTTENLIEFANKCKESDLKPEQLIERYKQTHFID